MAEIKSGYRLTSKVYELNNQSKLQVSLSVPLAPTLAALRNILNRIGRNRQMEPWWWSDRVASEIEKKPSKKRLVLSLVLFQPDTLNIHVINILFDLQRKKRPQSGRFINRISNCSLISDGCGLIFECKFSNRNLV